MNYDDCAEWSQSGVEPQETCPACGHYACSHALGVCLRCAADDDFDVALHSDEATDRLATERAVARSGFTADELRQQARDGRFENVKARLAWVAVGDLLGR